MIQITRYKIVNQCNYLDSLITNEEGCGSEVCRYFQMATLVTVKPTRAYITKKWKLDLVNSAKYASKTWDVKKMDVSHINAF